MKTYDSFELSILWQRLTTIADECWSTFRKTAFSPIITDALDIGCEIMDAQGLTLSHATRGMPVFNLVLPNVTGRIVELFPNDIAPGDVFITNDPWLCAGHLPDVAVVTPVFQAERLVGFVGSIANVTDIGGSLSRSAAREIYDEGLQIPPMHLKRNGAFVAPLLQIIERNVRESEAVLGDLHAQVTANAAAADHLLDFMDEYGLSEVDSLGARIRALSEQAMRDAIARVPNGTYTATDHIDLDDEPVELKISIVVQDDEVEILFPDCPPQTVQGGTNAALTYTTAHCVYLFQCLLAPDLPSNNGSFRPIRVWAPEGTILNCRRPAAVGLRTKTGWHVHPLILKALAPVLPDRVMAPGGGLSWVVLSGNDATGNAFQEHMVVSGGMGASQQRDGLAACGFPAATASVPVEVIEARSPVLIARKEYIAGSGGAGRTRGGLGQRVVIGRAPGWPGTIRASASLDHDRFPPDGILGGSAGTPSRFGLLDPTGALVHTRIHQATIARDDDRLVVEVAGGGGYGNPQERSPDAIAADVRAGFIPEPLSSGDRPA
jgi:N-methylhydantoinase B/oxoprolinase/acetone carboxylase alpha subunit